MKATIFLLTVLALATLSFARTMTRCSLAKELKKLGVPKNELAIWTCIAQRESSYRTHVVGPANSDGSRDFGIFQINDRYWCQADGRFSHNSCKIKCNNLLGDSVQPDLKCAQFIKKQQGWKAWSTWKYCNGKLPSIDSCF